MPELTPDEIASLMAPPPTPLLAALWGGDWDTAARLVEGGANPNAADTRFAHSLWTPLHVAVDADAPEVVRVLVAAGATVDARSECGQTPLWWACNDGRLAAARELLVAGANPNARCVEGYSPLGRVLRSHPVLMELLQSWGGVV